MKRALTSGLTVVGLMKLLSPGWAVQATMMTKHHPINDPTTAVRLSQSQRGHESICQRVHDAIASLTQRGHESICQ